MAASSDVRQLGLAARLQRVPELGAEGLEAAGAAQHVDRLVARGRDEPGARVRRAPVARPALERHREGILHRLLGHVRVADRRA